MTFGDTVKTDTEETCDTLDDLLTLYLGFFRRNTQKLTPQCLPLTESLVSILTYQTIKTPFKKLNVNQKSDHQ